MPSAGIDVLMFLGPEAPKFGPLAKGFGQHLVRWWEEVEQNSRFAAEALVQRFQLCGSVLQMFGTPRTAYARVAVWIDI